MRHFSAQFRHSPYIGCFQPGPLVYDPTKFNGLVGFVRHAPQSEPLDNIIIQHLMDDILDRVQAMNGEIPDTSFVTVGRLLASTP